MHPDHAINRASWDELAAIHGQDSYYDTAALIAGESSLIEEEEAALVAAGFSDMSGRRVLHVQCHLGFDAITFARRGARVTGVDFSAVALDKAQSAAAACGVAIDWVPADATLLPAELNGRFDLVWATMGVLCWIADLDAWMRSVTATLAAYGRLILIDGHPGEATKRSDFREGAGRRWLERGWDYATTSRTGPQVQYVWALSDIISSAVAAGLQIEAVREHADASRGLCIDKLRLEGDGRYRHRVNGEPVPVLFTLIAARRSD